MKSEYYKNRSLKDVKQISVYILLTQNKLVTYELFETYFEDTKRTFQRIITSIRESIEIVAPYQQIVYDKDRQGYRLISL